MKVKPLENGSVLLVYDQDTHCRIEKHALTEAETTRCAQLLEIKDNQPIYANLYDDEAVELCSHLSKDGVALSSFDPTLHYLILRYRIAFDDLPYDTHTDREYDMMLRSEKPMAYFCFKDGLSFEDVCAQPFDRLVAEGRVNEFRFSIPSRDASTQYHYVVYTSPTETWRANCLEFLKRGMALSPWSEGLERMEGSLLGFTDEENDIFLERIFRPRAKPS